MADSTVGSNLRNAREALGWSRATLADKSGTSEPAIARTELYGSQPRLATLLAWADALGVPVRDLVDPLVCECEEPDADPAVDFGMCQTCKRKPASLMKTGPVAS